MQDTQKISEMTIGEYLEYVESNPNFLVGEIFIDAIRRSMAKEVEEKAGSRYERGKNYSRWGSNPGPIVTNGERCRLDVPRIKDKSSGVISEPEVYKTVNRSISIPEKMVRAIINGLSQRKYKHVSQLVAEGFGLSQGTISHKFQKNAKAALEEFSTRDLRNYEFTALVIDGKYFAKEQIIHAVGITNRGDKIALGLIQSTTENSEAIKGLLKNLINRNLYFGEGILVISDGSKGIARAVDEVFGEKALRHRCQWHKRENVVSYLPEEKKSYYRRRINQAYEQPRYEAARSALQSLAEELDRLNHSVGRSMREGMEETLTMHRLGVREELGKSVCTTNIIENFNSQLEKRLKNVKRWRFGNMRSYWVAITLLEIEQNTKRIFNADKIYLLKHAMIKETYSSQVQIA